MTRAVARQWNLSWQRLRESMPDGPVSLWVAVLDGDRVLLGAAPVSGLPAWTWRDGQLTYEYGSVQVEIRRSGWVCTGFIVAVNELTGCYTPVLPFNIDTPVLVTPGQTLQVLNGRIGLGQVEGL